MALERGYYIKEENKNKLIAKQRSMRARDF